jgi:RNA polymerase sigma-70 factor (ECF subfamily)
MPGLAQTFLAAHRSRSSDASREGASGAGKDALGGVTEEALEEALAQALARARTACPGIGLDEATFAAEVGKRVPPDKGPLEALGEMHVGDIYLAVACAAGDGAALAELERRHGQEMRSTVTRMGFSASVADETLQVMRSELFVPAQGKPPRVLNYAGASELRSWLRAVAARTGLRVGRGAGPKTSELHEAVTKAADDDVEMEYLKRTYGELFQEVFVEALAAMAAGDRLLLKQRYRHEMSIEDLGSLYGVHASTISRRVTDTRERLLISIRDGMMRRLKVGRAEVSSILRLIQSRLDLSLSSVATEETTAPGSKRRA